MTDEEMMQLAAKAAGIKLLDWREAFNGNDWEYCFETEDGDLWNPLTDDGDALRLAVKLGLRVYIYPGKGDDYTVVGSDYSRGLSESHGTDPYAATRRAIVRAAAELGKLES